MHSVACSEKACRIGSRSDDMPFFRMRLILALIVGMTPGFRVGSSTYFDVLAHKLALRRELTRQDRVDGHDSAVRRSNRLFRREMSAPSMTRCRSHQRAGEMLGMAIYANPGGRLLAAAGANRCSAGAHAGDHRNGGQARRRGCGVRPPRRLAVARRCDSSEKRQPDERGHGPGGGRTLYPRGR